MPERMEAESAARLAGTASGATRRLGHLELASRFQVTRLPGTPVRLFGRVTLSSPRVDNRETLWGVSFITDDDGVIFQAERIGCL
jgi:hypothetical protein